MAIDNKALTKEEERIIDRVKKLSDRERHVTELEALELCQTDEWRREHGLNDPRKFRGSDTIYYSNIPEALAVIKIYRGYHPDDKMHIFD